MLFLNNSYLKELECKIVNINNNQIILNQTIFYAKSGGQPGDTGTLSNNENDINIIHTRSRAPAWSSYYASRNLIKSVSTFHNVYGHNNLFKRLLLYMSKQTLTPLN